MRAYYHYLLFEQYGPIPIATTVVEPTGDLDLPRQSVDEVVAFIDKELTAIMPLLPQTAITDELFLANPTKGVALAVKAKLWMYAASPLLNGGYAPAVSLANKDGKKLFPAKDQTKWNKALAATKEMISFAEQGNYELYKAFTNGVLDPEKSIYDLFQVYNKEIIWATSKNGWGGMDGDTLSVTALPPEFFEFAPIENDYNLQQIEKQHIQKVLIHTKGNKTETSRLLGIGLTTLYRKIEEYQIREI